MRKERSENGGRPLNLGKVTKEPTVWIFLAAVGLTVILVICTVVNKSKEKPDSPYAVLAAALARIENRPVEAIKARQEVNAQYLSPALVLSCPKCGIKGLAICSKCDSVMRSLGEMGNGGFLFACPKCGNVGTAMCPNDRSFMMALGKTTRPHLAKYFCPRCRLIGLPVWSAAGTPVCPGCRGVMGVN